MDEDARRAVERVAGWIAAYMALHPSAADSEEGIAQWWLPSSGTATPVAVVRDALELLVARGLAVRTALPDGRAIYRGADPAGRKGTDQP